MTNSNGVNTTAVASAAAITRSTTARTRNVVRAPRRIPRNIDGVAASRRAFCCTITAASVSQTEKVLKSQRHQDPLDTDDVGECCGELVAGREEMGLDGEEAPGYP